MLHAVKLVTIYYVLFAVQINQVIANCTDEEVRLVGGPSTNKGRLEVCQNKEWATVCDHHFWVQESTVVCAQLGFQRYGKLKAKTFKLIVNTKII